MSGVAIDQFFGKKYCPKNYNCAHFVCDVLAVLKSPEMGDVLRGFLCAKKHRKVLKDDLSKIILLDKPIDLCVVLMQRPKAATHVGIYVQGRVLHLSQQSVQCQPLDVVALGFKKVRFFTC
jgi:hypothetical protein